MANVLHVTAHLGGGVGKILSAVCCADKNNSHRILCLEQTQNLHFYNIAAENGVPVYQLAEGIPDRLFHWADIVQAEWWHHPMVTDFLVNTVGRTDVRLLVWSHISGCNYPRVPLSFIKSADKFIFTSPYSYENPSFNSEERLWVENNCSVIPSVGNDFGEIDERKEHGGFCVGYIGFLGYNKLHKDFVAYCKRLSWIPDIKFVIVGDTAYGGELLEDIKASGISRLFDIKGYSRDVNAELSGMDVFGYPLYPQHTGTTENSLLEAMAAGVVPVTLEQGAEKYIVENGRTGLTASDGEQYANAVAYLYEHPEKRKIMSEEAQSRVRKLFSLTHTVTKLNEEYEKLMERPKSRHPLDEVFGRTPFEWFKACYAGDLNQVGGLAMSETKGSLKQYARQFPEDAGLRACLERNEKKNGRDKMQL